MSVSHSFRASDEFNGRKAFAIRFQHRVDKDVAEGERFYFAFCYPYSYAEYQARFAALDAYFKGRLSRNVAVPRRFRLSGNPIDPSCLATCLHGERGEPGRSNNQADVVDNGQEGEETASASVLETSLPRRHLSEASKALTKAASFDGEEAFRKSSTSAQQSPLVYYYRELLQTSKQGERRSQMFSRTLQLDQDHRRAEGC